MLTFTATEYHVALNTSSGTLALTAAPSPALTLAIVQSLKGDEGAPGGQLDVRVAGEVLGGHRVVRSLPDGRIGYASALNAEHGDDTVGLTVQAAVVDATVNVQRAGSVTFAGWAWTPGEPVFLAADGTLTQALLTDVDGAAFMQVVGHAESPTALFVDIQPPIYY